MAAVLARQDHLYTLIEKGDGEPAATVIGSIVGYVHAPPGRDDGARRARRRAEHRDPLADDHRGGLRRARRRSSSPPARADVRPPRRRARRPPRARRRAAHDPQLRQPAGQRRRGARARRSPPRRASTAALRGWIEEHCTFPNSMVDRITPVTAEADRDWLREARGIDDGWPVVAEPFRQWVMEDAFAAGRPAWERGRRALHATASTTGSSTSCACSTRGTPASPTSSALAGHRRSSTRRWRVPRCGGFLEDLLLARGAPHPHRDPRPPARGVRRVRAGALREHRACVTRSPACASTAAPSSRRS